MNLEVYIIIGLSLIILLFLILYILTKIKYIKLDKAYIKDNKEFIQAKSKLSMVEYHYRNYKEGKNPFTVLRDISVTLSEEDINEQKEEDRT